MALKGDLLTKNEKKRMLKEHLDRLNEFSDDLRDDVRVLDLPVEYEIAITSSLSYFAENLRTAIALARLNVT